MNKEKCRELLFKWIKTLSTEEMLPKNIKALNFGIFESENGYIVHLYGCESFDKQDDEWSYREDYVPNKRFLEFDQDDVRSMPWESFQSLISQTLRDITKDDLYDEYSMLAVEHITTGFDDGDLVIVK